MSAADEIRTLLDARIDALRDRDATSANALLDRHVVAFELAGPLQIPSEQATDNSLTQAWLDSFSEGPNVTVEQLSIHLPPGHRLSPSIVRDSRTRGGSTP